MIRDTVSHKKNPALTSDHWHVVHARWTGEAEGEAQFVRAIVSEHEDSASAANAARKIVTALTPEMVKRPRAGRDQIFVRRPDFKSLKTAGPAKRKRK